MSMLAVAEQGKVDSIIVGGDLVPHYLPDKTSSNRLDRQESYLTHTLIPAIQDFKRKRDIPIYLDLGNDDFIGSRPILEAHNGQLFHLLHMAKRPLTDGIDIIGYMNVPPTPFERKDWERPDTKEWPFAPGNRITLDGYLSSKGSLQWTVIDLNSTDTIQKDLDQLSKDIINPFIFVSHSPPYNTPLDVIYDGTHVGSQSILRFIERWSNQGKIIASLHGHIHESPRRSGTISTMIGSALCINPGQESRMGRSFRYAILELTEEDSQAKIRILKPA
jgi:Icc-related predicted phosphoesterase